MRAKCGRLILARGSLSGPVRPWFSVPATYALVLLAALTVAPPASAQNPVDPLHRPVHEAGAYGYGVGLSVTPLSTPTLYQDGSGGVVQALDVQYGIGVHADVYYGLNRRLRLLFNARADTAVRRRFVPPSPVETGPWRQDGTIWSGSVGLLWHASPRHAWDPTLAVTRDLGEAGATILQAAGQRIADPVVVSAGLFIRHPGGTNTDGKTVTASGESGEMQVGIRGGFGFIFNDKWSASAHVLHRFASRGQPLPITSVTVGLRHMTDARGSGMEYDLVFSERGNGAVVQLGITWHGTDRR